MANNYLAACEARIPLGPLPGEAPSALAWNWAPCIITAGTGRLTHPVKFWNWCEGVSEGD